MNIPQMMMQAMMQGMSPMQNPMVREIVQLKRQGASPQETLQQLAQRHPQFRQALPYLQNKSPQQMDMTARNAVQSSGVNPNDMMQQLQKYI